MTISIPHPIPYQGSKRRLAKLILSYAPKPAAKMFEPFAGSAATTIAAAARGVASKYVIGDSLRPLAELWDAIIRTPEDLSRRYERLWNAQFKGPSDHYLEVRAQYNRTREPVDLLYLMARCVKNAVRFNAYGEFNQSADHRRTGVGPGKMRAHIRGASDLLAGCCRIRCGDYEEILNRATDRDFVYMDPPYQGVSGVRDSRYHEQLDLERLICNLDRLNTRRVPFVLSFDGSLGPKAYGRELPKYLNLTRVLVNTGRSSQATLNGEEHETVESLYLSPGLGGGGPVKLALSVKDGSAEQLSLLASG